MIQWGSSNFKEILPDRVSPFTESILSDVFIEALKTQYFSIGYQLPSGPGDLIDVFQGKPYFNFTLMAKIAEECWSQDQNKVLEILGGLELDSLKSDGPKKIGISAKIGSTIRGLRAIKAVFHAISETRKLSKKKCQLYELVPTSNYQANNDSGLSYSEVEAGLREALTRHFKISLIAGFCHDVVNKNCTEYSYHDEQNQLRSNRDYNEAVNVTQQKEFLKLVDIYHDEGGDSVEFNAALTSFINNYGHRCLYEMEISQKRPYEDKSIIMEQIELLAKRVGDPSYQDMNLSNYVEGRKKRNSKNPTTSFVLKVFSKLAHKIVVERERSKDYLAYEMAKLRSHVIANTAIPKEDIFYLTRQEFMALEESNGDIPAELNEKIQMRKIANQAGKSKYSEYICTDIKGVITNFQQSVDQEVSAQKYKGIPISPGSIAGNVHIIRNLDDAYGLKKGDIAVTHALDSGYAPLFALASGIITEIGGVVSHGAIIAREFKIPSIFNVPGIVEQLKNGDRVTMDCSTGIISIESS